MEQEQEPLVFSGGAVRSGRLPKYRLLPKSFLKHVALAFTEGADRYEKLPSGRPTPLTSNWRRGDLTFFLAAVDHLQAHTATFADKLLELGLLLQNTPAVQNNPAIIHEQIRQLLEELGHAGANIAFLTEWLDSGAALAHLVREVLEVQALTAAADAVETLPPAEQALEESQEPAPLAPADTEKKPQTALERFLADGIAKAEREKQERLAKVKQ